MNAVAAPAITQYQYLFCRGVQQFYRTVPMMLYVVAGKLGRILCLPYGQVAFVVARVIYAVGDHRALGKTVEIMVVDFLRPLGVQPAVPVKIAQHLLLLAVDAQNGQSLPFEALLQQRDVLELCVPVSYLLQCFAF